MAKRTQSLADKMLTMTSDEWSIENLTGIPERELRQMYSQQRDIMRKRIDRLKNAGYGDAGILERFELAPKLSTLKDKSAIVRELKDMHRFLGMRLSTVKGQKESEADFVKRMSDVADRPVSLEEAKRISKLMSKVGNAVKDKQLKYKVVLQMLRVAEDKGIKNTEKFFKDVEFWAANIDMMAEVGQITTPTGKPSQSAAAYRKAIKYYRKLRDFTGE